MRTLALDAGHGHDTAGKGVPGLKEYDFNRAVVGFARDRALAQGFRRVVLCQGLADEDTPLPTRTQRAFDAGAEAVISVHADANPDPAARGHWVFYWHDNAPSKRLAEIWDELASKMLPIPRRGPRASKPGTWTNFHMTRVPASRRTPAILIEHGFMTHPEDLSHLKSDEYRHLCAEILVRACCGFFDMEYVKGVAAMGDSKAPAWKTEAVDYFADRNMLSDSEGWKHKIDEPMPAWATFIMLRRIHEDLRR